MKNFKFYGIVESIVHVWTCDVDIKTTFEKPFFMRKLTLRGIIFGSIFL